MLVHTSDGNDVGWDISGHITTLGLNDREGGKGTGAEGLVHLGGTLEQSRVQVENVSRVSLTSRRTTEQKGHLSVGNGLLGQVIVDDQGVLSVVTEPLSHGTTREGSEVLERGGLGGGGGDNDGVLHGVVLLEGLDKLGDGRSLLADGDVDTVKLLLLVGTVVPLLLVKNGVDGNGGLSGLTVTDDKLTLTTSDRNQGVDRLETSLHRLVDGSSGQNTGGLKLGLGSVSGLDRSFTVNGLSQSVNNTAEKTGSDWDIDNLSSSLDSVTLLDETIVTENGDTDVVGLQVQAHSSDTGRELNHLLGLDVSETVDTGDTVTDGLGLDMEQTWQVDFVHSLNTRPVSWTSPPVEAPAIRPSRMEETSEAAVVGKKTIDEMSGWTITTRFRPSG